MSKFRKRIGKVMGKQKSVMFLLVFCLLFSLNVPSNAIAKSKTKLKIEIDGKTVKFSPSPFIKNGIVYVPAKKYIKKLKGRYAIKSNKIVVKTQNKKKTYKLKFKANSKVAFVNAKKIAKYLDYDYSKKGNTVNVKKKVVTITPTVTSIPIITSTPTPTIIVTTQPTPTEIVTPSPTKEYGGVLDDGFEPTPVPIADDTKYDPATTIFVATNGTDVGAGTIDKPYATFSHAQSEVVPGGTVYVRAGTYKNQSFLIRSVGESGKWITFKNYNDEKVILEGTGLDGESKPHVISLYKAKYVIVDGFTVRNFTGSGIINDDSYQTIIRNCDVYNGLEGGIGGSGQYLIYEDNSIVNCILGNENNKRGAWGSGLATTKIRPASIPTSNVVFRRNLVEGNWGEGLNAFMATNVVIEDNIVKNNFSVNLYCDTAKDVYIVNNKIIADDSIYYRSGAGAVGVQIANEGTNNTLTLIPQYNVTNITVINNEINGGVNGIGYWEDPNNQTTTNTYSKLNFVGNKICNISGTPIKIGKVTIPLAPAPYSCIIRENDLYKSKAGYFTSIGDESAWNLIDNNLIG